MKFLIIAVSVAMSGLASPAEALEQKMVDWCIGKRNASPEQIARGCTAIINSKRTKGEPLASAYLNRGLAYSRMGDNERALSEYAIAAKIAPRFVLLHVNRSAVLSELSRHEEALAAASLAVEINPRATLGYYNRANILSNMGKFEASLVDFDRAIKLDPKFSNSYNNRANALMKLKRYEEAVADATMAIKLLAKGTPKSEQAIPYGTRSAGYSALRNLEAALKDTDTAISLFERPQYLRARASILEDLDRPEQGLPDVERLIALDAKDAIAWNSRCWLEALSGRLTAALQSCNTSLGLDPNNRNTHDSRGLVHLKMGKLDEALADYNAALKIGGYAGEGKASEDVATSLYGRGLVRQRKGDVLGSAVDLAAARASKSNLPELYQERYLKR